MDRTNIEIAERRIALLSARAARSNDPESWRALRNVAAAYGEKEIAALAHCKITTQPKAQEDDVLINRSFQISSLTPLARRAWLSRWAADKGVSIEKNGDVFILTGTTALLQKLNDHPEFVSL